MTEKDAHYQYEFSRSDDKTSLIKNLVNGDEPQLRYRAAESLGELPQATDRSAKATSRVNQALLRAAKTDPNEGVRAAAIGAMLLRDSDAFESLIDDLSGHEYETTPTWVPVDSLTEWLTVEYPELRLVAVNALGRIGDERATGHVVGVIDDTDVRVRMAAIEALEEIDDPRSVPALRSRLLDSQQQVRKRATGALASVGTHRAFQALSQVADAGPREVKLDIIESLATVGTDSSLSIFVERLSDPSSKVRTAAVRSIMELLTDDDGELNRQTRQKVATEVRAAEPPEFITDLLRVVDEATNGDETADEDETTEELLRRNATWLVGALIDTESDTYTEASEHLIQSLDDPDPYTAKIAISALSRLEDDDLNKRLYETMRSEDLSLNGRKRAAVTIKNRVARQSEETTTSSEASTPASDQPERETGEHGDTS